MHCPGPEYIATCFLFLGRSTQAQNFSELGLRSMLELDFVPSLLDIQVIFFKASSLPQLKTTFFEELLYTYHLKFYCQNINPWDSCKDTLKIDTIQQKSFGKSSLHVYRSDLYAYVTEGNYCFTQTQSAFLFAVCSSFASPAPNLHICFPESNKEATFS